MTRSILCCLTVLLVAQSASAGSAHAGDAGQGARLHAERCDACHAQKSAFGDPAALYTRSDRKVKDLARLKSMVALCNTELRLDLFPDDEQDLVAHLNERYYRFMSPR